MEGARKTPAVTQSDPAAPLSGAPPLPSGDVRWALFLDVDGTLLDIAPTPEGVVVTSQLRQTLQRLHDALDGAVALVSGRSLLDLDQLFAPLTLPAAGLHGAEWRDGAGACHEIAVDPAAINQMRREAEALAANLPGVRVEDKGRGLALHWRQAPAAEAALREGAAAIAERTGLVVQPGKCVFELKPLGVDKGSALRHFLEQPPFQGRRPLFIGDDLTDAFAVEAAQSCGGLAIRVGETLAQLTEEAFVEPAAVRDWLASWSDTLRR